MNARQSIVAALGISALLFSGAGCSSGDSVLTSANPNPSSATPSGPETSAFSPPSPLLDFPPRDLNLSAATNLIAFWKMTNGKVDAASVTQVVDDWQAIAADQDKEVRNRASGDGLKLDAEIADARIDILGGTLSDGKTSPGYVLSLPPGSSAPALTVRFGEGGQIDLELEHWIPPAGWESPDGATTTSAPSFRTADGSVIDAKYTPLGGKFSFTVVTRWAEYGFQIARVRYDAADNAGDPTKSAASPHYAGTVELHSDDASQPLPGFVILD